MLNADSRCPLFCLWSSWHFISSEMHTEKNGYREKVARESQKKNICCEEVSHDVTHLHHITMATPHQHQLTVGRNSQCLWWYVTVKSLHVSTVKWKTYGYTDIKRIRILYKNVWMSNVKNILSRYKFFLCSNVRTMRVLPNKLQLNLEHGYTFSLTRYKKPRMWAPSSIEKSCLFTESLSPCSPLSLRITQGPLERQRTLNTIKPLWKLLPPVLCLGC